MIERSQLRECAKNKGNKTIFPIDRTQIPREGLNQKPGAHHQTATDLKGIRVRDWNISHPKRKKIPTI